MVIVYMFAGILGGLLTVGGALLLDLPLVLILCAYPVGGMGGTAALLAFVLLVPLPLGLALSDADRA